MMATTMRASRPEDCWTVISSFFDTKGLVSQQTDSFNEFTQTTIQDLVNEYSTITLDQPNPPSAAGEKVALRRYEIKFGTVMVSRPTISETDGTVTVAAAVRVSRPKLDLR